MPTTWSPRRGNRGPTDVLVEGIPPWMKLPIFQALTDWENEIRRRSTHGIIHTLTQDFDMAMRNKKPLAPYAQNDSAASALKSRGDAEL